MDARRGGRPSRCKKSFPLAGGASLEVLDVGHLALPAATCTVLRGRSGAGQDHAV